MGVRLINYGLIFSSLWIMSYADVKVPFRKVEEKPGCNHNIAQTPEVAKLAQSSKLVNRYVACKADIEKGGYDSDSCHQYEMCARAILGTDDLKDVLYSDFFNKTLLPVFGGITADHISNKMLAKQLNNIEQSKLLRKFAEKLGVDIADKKACEEKGLTEKCNADEFDKIFQNLQKNCGSESGFNCYKLDEKEYTSIEKASPSELKADVYLDRIAESKALDAIANDASVLNELFTSLKNVKESKKSNGQNAVNKLEEVLKNLEQQRKLDPFLSLVKDDRELKEKLAELIVKNSAKKEGVTAQFNEFRKKILKEAFTGYSCEAMPTLKGICETKKAIETNNKDAVKPMSSFELSDLTKNEDYSSEYEKIKTLKDIGLYSKEEYLALVKGFQCYMFIYNPKVLDFQCVRDDLAGDLKNSSFGKGSSDVIKYNFEEQKFTVIKNNDGSQEIQKSVETILKNKSHGEVSGESKTVETVSGSDNVDLNKTIQESLNSNGLTGPMPIIEPIKKALVNDSNFIPMNDSLNADHDIKNDGKNTDFKNSSENNQLLDKINELTKKVSASEEALNKLKENKKKKNENESTKKEIADDRNDQVKGLENQIKALKTELANSNKVYDGRVESKNAGINTSYLNKLSREDVKDFNPSHPNINNSSNMANETTLGLGNNFTAPERLPSSVGSVSTPIANIYKFDNTSNNSRYQGLVLTKVDGLSNELLSEAINSKISESNGQPFFIEEGGFVKEIVPVLKDGKIVLDEKGKPLFEKIIKGKVSDIKQKESAKVGNQADLKKLEDLKVKAEQDRLKYEALKKISAEAMK